MSILQQLRFIVMRPARSELIRKILLEINGKPSSIYDILYSMTGCSDSKRNRLPKLLKSMESEGLVVSALQPGPLGPYRRMYEMGPEAEVHLRESLKDCIETILHFYDVYRQANPQKLYNFPEKGHQPRPKGRILYAAFPHLKTSDLETIRELIQISEDSRISVVGTDLILRKTGINYDVVGSEISSISVDNKTYSDIFLHGIPEISKLPRAIAECKRVLTRRGVLRIRVPYAFFNEPEKPTIEEFIRITSCELFPELGVVEGNEIRRVIEQYFPNLKVYEASLGEVIFEVVKS